MKGLRKYLTPFAPDQSGAVSVLYELGGILVVCDAGGCVGNICGFDEPRWQKSKSAIFSAGLRDMDAIMGRDELLVKKLALAAEKIDAKFAALIGTPVTFLIGTDYQALSYMAEDKIKIPVIAVNTNGMDLYDAGASKAYLELVKNFAVPSEEAEMSCEEKKITCVLGCNPIDFSDLFSAEYIRNFYKNQKYDEVLTIGMSGSFEDLNKLPYTEKNIVVSVSGLSAAKFLKEKYGIPYEVRNVAAEKWAESISISGAEKILVVGQQVFANSVREKLLEKNQDLEVTVSSWFKLEKELMQEGDVHLGEEDQFEQLVKDGDFDVIIADPILKKMVKSFNGIFIERKEFALSGKMEESS